MTVMRKDIILGKAKFFLYLSQRFKYVRCIRWQRLVERMLIVHGPPNKFEILQTVETTFTGLTAATYASMRHAG